MQVLGTIYGGWLTVCKKEVKARMTQMHTLRLTKQKVQRKCSNKAGYVMDCEMEAGRIWGKMRKVPIAGLNQGSCSSKGQTTI